MLISKKYWLPLALPLLLAGCKDVTPATPDPVVSVTKTKAPPVEWALTDDPVTQVDTLNEKIGELVPPNKGAVEAKFAVTTNEATNVPQVANDTILSGDYAYDLTYGTPNGPTFITFSFTLNNNKITAASLEGNPFDATSTQYQKLFATKLGSLVVGKDRSQVQAVPVRVNGSSLTPSAFNQALAKLKAQA